MKSIKDLKGASFSLVAKTISPLSRNIGNFAAELVCEQSNDLNKVLERFKSPNPDVKPFARLSAIGASVLVNVIFIDNAMKALRAQAANFLPFLIAGREINCLIYARKAGDVVHNLVGDTFVPVTDDNGDELTAEIDSIVFEIHSVGKVVDQELFQEALQSLQMQQFMLKPQTIAEYFGTSAKSTKAVSTKRAASFADDDEVEVEVEVEENNSTKPSEEELALQVAQDAFDKLQSKANKAALEAAQKAFDAVAAE